MRNVQTVCIGDNSIEVRELTLAEIRAWLAWLETGQGNAGVPDLLDTALFDDFGLSDLLRMTSMTAADMEASSPSELRKVYDACQEVNRDFFSMRARLMDLGRAALATSGVD